jgi:endonuclease-3
LTIQKKTGVTVARLEKKFGVPAWKGKTDPLSDLIRTVLSQNTNDRNRDLAYDALKERYPTWKQVMQASQVEVAETIRSAGLSNQKSDRIIKILKWINSNYGSLNLDFICDMDSRDATQTFIQLKGIGIKTISVVLMFSCGKDIFPVDTHVHRICRRLGLVPENYSAEKTHWAMQEFVPEGKSYSLHMNLLKLGRTICKARKPSCQECPLKNICNYTPLKT